MRTTATIYTRRFPVTIRDGRTGAEMQDYITLDKAQLQAAQLVGMSSKELIYSIYNRRGFRVLDIGKAEKGRIEVELSGGGVGIMEREYCAAWPQELKEAEQRRYRAACRVKMLEAQLDRIGPEEFDQLMEQIEAAQAEVYEAGGDVLRLKWKFYS